MTLFLFIYNFNHLFIIVLVYNFMTHETVGKHLDVSV